MEMIEKRILNIVIYRSYSIETFWRTRSIEINGNRWKNAWGMESWSKYEDQNNKFWWCDLCAEKENGNKKLWIKEPIG